MTLMDNELEELKKKKLEELQKKYMKSANPTQETMPNTPLQITDADIDATLNKYPLIVIDCWAPWCGPCRMVGPVIEELAKEMQGKIVFGKLNVDNNRATAAKYAIMSIPTLLVFKNNQLVETLIGAMPKEMIQAKLKPHM